MKIQSRPVQHYDLMDLSREEAVAIHDALQEWQAHSPTVITKELADKMWCFLWPDNLRYE